MGGILLTSPFFSPLPWADASEMVSGSGADGDGSGAALAAGGPWVDATSAPDIGQAVGG